MRSSPITHVVPARPSPAVTTAGSIDLFPFRRVYCVERNCAEHAREIGHDPMRQPTFFFAKTPENFLAASLDDGEADFPYLATSQGVRDDISDAPN